MNYHFSGLRVAYALLVTGLGILTQVDSAAALAAADESETNSDKLHHVAFGTATPLKDFTVADAAYAEAMEEHISRLA